MSCNCAHSGFICRWQEAFGPNFAGAMRAKCKEGHQYGFPPWVKGGSGQRSHIGNPKATPQFQQILFDQSSILPNGQHLCFWPSFDYMLTHPKALDTRPGILGGCPCCTPVNTCACSGSSPCVCSRCKLCAYTWDGTQRRHHDTHDSNYTMTKEDMKWSDHRYHRTNEHFALINGIDNDWVEILHPGEKMGILVNTELVQLGFEALQALPCNGGHARVPESMLRVTRLCYDCCKYRVTKMHAAQPGEMIYVHRERKHQRCTGTETKPNCKLVVKPLAELRVMIHNK